jgi:hypothetical protein
MIADQNFYDTCFTFFYPTAAFTAYGQRPNFFRAEHLATAEGGNCAYGPTPNFYAFSLKVVKISLPNLNQKFFI